MSVARPAPQGAHYLLAPLTENKEGSMGLMILRVRPTPTRFPTNILAAAAAVAQSNGQSGLADEFKYE